LREAFKNDIEQCAQEQLVYVDESGIDETENYPYGWCPKGERFWAEKTGKKRHRVSMIGALNQSQFKAPFLFDGYCDSHVFEQYIEHCLVPVLIPGQKVIADNASFHKSARAKQLIEKAGCSFKFLPPYSPDLNPIEHSWFPIKNNIRKALAERVDIYQATEQALKQASEPI
jgi:transposase